MIYPLHALAAASGVVPAPDGAGIDCALCGPGSPYPQAKRVKDATAVEMLQELKSSSGWICAACYHCISGAPNKENPPLRARSIIYEEGQGIRHLAQSEWWDIIRAPRNCIISWAIGGKKHHILSAGWSTPDIWRAGTDDGIAEWRPDAAVLAAIDGLRRRGIAKAAILSGIYGAKALAAHGAVIDAAEPLLRPYRGGLPLDLMVFASPTYEKAAQTTEGSKAMISESETKALDLLARIAWGSEMRAQDGKIFWGGFYLARIRRYARLPAGEMVSRLFDDCRVGASFAAPIAADVAAMTAPQEEGIGRACRERTSLLHALALERMAHYRSGKENQEALL